MATSYPGTQAVIRALKLLKLFGEGQETLSLQEIVDASGLNKTTAFRLLSALESEGLLERSENNGYRLGPEMVALGGRAIQQNGLIQVSEPILNDLMRTVGERVTLEQPIRNGDGSLSMLLLIQVQSHHMIGINQLYGTRLPIHATSTGKAYLAFLDQAERDSILADQMDRFTDETIVDPTVLAHEMAVVRSQGFATALGELEHGLMAVGAPVFDHTGQPIAAISIEGPDSRIDKAKISEMATDLCVAASKISIRLGHRPQR